jgi:hypothetical protein
LLKGIHLTLLIGPGVPVPAPQPVTDALIRAQVTNGLTRSGFQLVFGLSKQSLLSRALLPAGYFDPGVRVILVVTVGPIPEVLIDGIITRQEVAPGNQAGEGKLTITGEDLSVLMDVVSLKEFRYPALPAPAIVALILARYVVFGIVPLVIPPIFNDVPIPTDRIPSQSGTDLEYMRKLASDNGHVFFVQAGPAPGANIAYWGPDIRLPIPQPALNVNMDAHTNVESLTFSLDGLVKKIVVYLIYDPVTKKIALPVPVPNISLLRPPLGARIPVPLKVEFNDDVAKKNAVQAIAQALAKTAESTDAVTANGSLDVLRYGQTLKARQIVGVRGAGLAYDGLYYVRSVTHNLKRGEFKQNFTLSRDGLVSITPTVLP